MAKQITFADAAKDIMKRYEKRLGKKLNQPDQYAKEAMSRELQELSNKQEEIKSKNAPSTSEDSLPQFWDGGNIRNQTNFTGGLSQTEQDWYNYNSMNNANSIKLNPSPPPPPNPLNRPEVERMEARPISNAIMNLDPLEGIDLDAKAAKGNIATAPSYETSIAPALIGGGISAAANIANAAFSADAAKKSYKELRPVDYSPTDVSFAKSREQARAENLNARRRALNEIRKGGTDDYSSLALDTILKGDNILSNSIIRSLESEENINTQQRNQAAQINAGNRNRVNQINNQGQMRSDMMKNQAITSAIGNIAGTAQGVTSDIVATKRYDDSLQYIMENYKPIRDPQTGKLTFVPRTRIAK